MMQFSPHLLGDAAVHVAWNAEREDADSAVGEAAEQAMLKIVASHCRSIYVAVVELRLLATHNIAST